uniref:Uncharacterized protein n=1 Tax=Anguilla anguilla TaxID=7936 RepID=A0A0E9PD69_ANGAN
MAHFRAITHCIFQTNTAMHHRIAMHMWASAKGHTLELQRVGVCESSYKHHNPANAFPLRHTTPTATVIAVM